MKQILALSHARKSYDGKVVLDDVTLALLPGAKVGVVGPNGIGKSTLLRMMAGLERPSNGEVRLMPGYSAGILPQEPVLDETRTVLGTVAEGVAETKAFIGRYNEIAAKLAAEYPTSCWRRWAGCRSSSTTGTPRTWTAAWSRRWTRCAAPARRRGHQPVRRGAAPGGAVPAPAPAGRPISAPGGLRSPAARTWRRSGSRDRTSKSRPGRYPAASGAGLTWR